MTNNENWCATHEYRDDIFEIECPRCKEINIVTIFRQDGHVFDDEECYCANCHSKIREFHASSIKTELKK